MLSFLLNWLRVHRNQVHLISLAIMVGTSSLLYRAAIAELNFVIWGLLSLFILANLLELSLQ